MSTVVSGAVTGRAFLMIRSMLCPLEDRNWILYEANLDAKWNPTTDACEPLDQECLRPGGGRTQAACEAKSSVAARRVNGHHRRSGQARRAIRGSRAARGSLGLARGRRSDRCT